VTITPTEQPARVEMPDPSEFLIKEAREAARRRRMRVASMIAVLIVGCLIALAVAPLTSSPTKARGGRPDSTPSVLTCPRALVTLLGVSSISGGLGHSGLLVRAMVRSSPGCTMSGYPLVGDELAGGSAAMATNRRLGYLGGFANEHAPLPQISVTSQPREVSFTIQMAGCNARPWVNVIQITLPGSRRALRARSMYEAGIGVVRGFGIYCGHLFVTPLVNGSSGSVG
jgi:hypothetical protein